MVAEDGAGLRGLKMRALLEPRGWGDCRGGMVGGSALLKGSCVLCMLRLALYVLGDWYGKPGGMVRAAVLCVKWL
eukprot:scaffold55862_cov20-Tisochrysis_lutea.AAC.3